MLLLDDQISVQAYSDGELSNYSEDDASFVNELRDKAIKPNHKVIKPSHETNVSQATEETRPNGQTRNDPASTSSL